MPTTAQWQIRMKEKAKSKKWKGNMSSVHFLDIYDDWVSILTVNVNYQKKTKHMVYLLCRYDIRGGVIEKNYICIMSL